MHAPGIGKTWLWDREGLQLHGAGATGLIGTTAATTAIQFGRAGILTTLPGDLTVSGVTTLVGPETFEGLVTVTSATLAGAAGVLGPEEMRVETTQAATAGATIRNPGYIDWSARTWETAVGSSTVQRFGQFGAVVTAINAPDGVPTAYRLAWADTAGVVRWSADEAGLTRQAGVLDSSLTQNGALYAGASGRVTSTGALTNGQLLVGSTGVAPALGTLTQPAAGLTIAGGAGTITFALANDLAAVEGLGTTGLAVRSAADTWATRSVVATSASIVVANGTGAADNIGIDTAQNIQTSASPTFAGLTVGAGLTTLAGNVKIGAGAGSNSALLMLNRPAGSAVGVQLFQDGVASWIIQNPASSTELRFSESGVTAMTLTAAGALSAGSLTLTTDLAVGDGGTGIGTVPSAGQVLLGGAGVWAVATNLEMAPNAALRASSLTAGDTLLLQARNTSTLSWTTFLTLTSAATPTCSLRLNTQAAFQLEPYGTLAGQTSEARFLELAANGTNYVGFKAPDAIAANVIWTLPSADGTVGQVLQTSGAGALSWASAGGGGWTDDVAVVRLTTAADTVSVGAAAPDFTGTGITATKLYVANDGATSVQPPVFWRASNSYTANAGDFFVVASSTGSLQYKMRFDDDTRGGTNRSLHVAIGGNGGAAETEKAAPLSVTQSLGSQGWRARAIYGKCNDAGLILNTTSAAWGVHGVAIANDGAGRGTAGQGHLGTLTGVIGMIDYQASSTAHTGDIGGVIGLFQAQKTTATGTPNTAFGVKGYVSFGSDQTGTLTYTTGAALIAHSPTIEGGTATARNITNALGLLVRNQGTGYSITGAGTLPTITNAIGVDILEQTNGATLNLGLRCIGTVALGNHVSGAAPAAGLADTVLVYSSDDTAGNTIPSFYCEGTGVLQTAGDIASTRRVRMRINNTVVELLAVIPV